MSLFRKILYFVDVQEPEQTDLQHAVSVAEVSGADLTFAAVVDMGARRPQLFPRYDTEELERMAVEERLESLSTSVAALPASSRDFSTRVLLGEPAAAVAEAVKTDGYDLVIKAPVGPTRRKLDTTEMRLLRGCPCAVNVTRPGEGLKFQRLLAAIDVDSTEEYQAELNRVILDYASVIHGVAYPELHIVHAWSLYGETHLGQGRTRIPEDDLRRMLQEEETLRQQQLDNLIQEYKAAHVLDPGPGTNVTLHLVHGDPTEVIPQIAREVDAQLLVISTASRTKLKGFLIGNTAESVLNKVECSVLTVKPEGFLAI